MVGRRPNHPESAMIALIKRCGFKEGETNKTYVKWNRRSLKRARLGTGDFYANCIWGPFKGGGPYELDIAFPDGKLDLEIDGAAFHEVDGLRKLRDEKRDAVLRCAGWTVVRVTDAQVYRVFVPLLNMDLRGKEVG
jgi:hypothetical protein